MSMSRIRGWRFWALTVAAVVIAVPVLGAQSSKSVPDLLGQIITMLQSVQQSLDGLTHEEGNVLFTPRLVGTTPDLSSIECTATNVSSSTHTISVELIDPNTGLVKNSISEAVSPNKLTGTIWFAPAVVFCKITVTDGVKSDVRGMIELVTKTAQHMDGYAAQ